MLEMGEGMELPNLQLIFIINIPCISSSFTDKSWWSLLDINAVILTYFS